jgi:hypothetical protein
MGDCWSRRDPRPQLVSLLLPLLTPMDVGRVMACAHNGVPQIERINPSDGLLFKHEHVILQDDSSLDYFPVKK